MYVSDCREAEMVIFSGSPVAPGEERHAAVWDASDGSRSVAPVVVGRTGCIHPVRERPPRVHCCVWDDTTASLCNTVSGMNCCVPFRLVLRKPVAHRWYMCAGSILHSSMLF